MEICTVQRDEQRLDKMRTSAARAAPFTLCGARGHVRAFNEKEPGIAGVWDLNLIMEITPRPDRS
jgi:hypothetical protein